MKRIISMVLVVILLAVNIPLLSTAYDNGGATTNTPTITAEKVMALQGTTAEVDISIAENPGIIAAGITVSFGEGLVLTGAKSGDAFSALSFTPPAQLSGANPAIASSAQFAWFAAGIQATDIKDGIVLTLTFSFSEQAQLDTEYYVNVSYNTGDILDKDSEPITANIVNGSVTMLSYTSGDVNQDARINMLDIIMLSRYYVDGCKYDPDGYAVSIIDNAADVNGDGRINLLDIVTLNRYYVDGCKYDPNGYAVMLKPGNICSHSIAAIEAKEASCTENGNTAYWKCNLCNKLFGNAECSVEISIEDTVLNALGHTVVIDHAVAATYDATGLTEGSHCSVCNEVIVEQQVVPKLQLNAFAIVYNNTRDADNPNPSEYLSQNGLVLKDISASGYRFDGWYDKADNGIKESDRSSEQGTLITAIAQDTSENVQLYAHWTIITYQINYYLGDETIVSGNPEYTPKEYTIESPTITLRSASLENGLLFNGWKDENGNTVATIPQGSTGNITLVAQWKSARYLATPLSEFESKGMSAPRYTKNTKILDYEDGTQTVLFVYYLGCIENIPVASSGEVYYHNGAELSKTYTVTKGSEKSVSSSFSKAIEETISSTASLSSTITTGITATAGIEALGAKSEVEASLETSVTASLSVTGSQSLEKSFTDIIGSAFSEQESYSYTISFTSNMPKGYYRTQKMGTADVYAVFEYNPVDGSCTYVTRNVFRDTFYNSIDYSKNSDFSDSADSELPFEYSDEINEYIASATEYSEGLIFSGNTVIAYTGTDTDVVIPWYYNGKRITEIKSTVFKNKANITSIKLGNAIETISDSAFSGCTELTSVILPTGIKSIGAYAFKDCAKLVTALPESVTSVGDGAFSGCASLKSIAIKEGLTHIGANAFIGCYDLTLTIETQLLTVASSAASSGAANIVLSVLKDSKSLSNSTINVPEATRRFELKGNGNTFTNVYIISNASETTVIDNVKIDNDNGNGSTAVQVGSADTVLIAVEVVSNGGAVYFGADESKLLISGDALLTAGNGDDAIYATKNLSVSQYDAALAGNLRAFGGNGTPGGNGIAAIGVFSISGYLTLDVSGGAGVGAGVGIKAQDVNIKTNTDATIRGGNGVKGASSGASGSDGGIGIYADNLTIDMTGNLYVYGGNGGNGMQGKTGTTGVMGLGNDSNMRDGGKGGTGGKGGNGADAVFVKTIDANNSSVILYGGAGGNGGAGGKGGNGGPDLGVPYVADAYGLNGGDGGNGGKGGNGGSGTVPGKAGSGGAGGKGGDGVSKTHFWGNVRNGDDGSTGSKGADGNPGIIIQ